jgi:UDP-N-acetylglucosamine 2-epimerase (non-hydrolysing)
MTNQPRIHFLIGTKAQLIKLAPVMKALDDRQCSYRIVDSGQHAETTRSLREAFSLQAPDVSLRTGRDITTISSALVWFTGLLWATVFKRKHLKRDIFPGGGLCVVHGDTLSTLLGMLLAKSAGLSIAHIEAGLRSGRLFDPFPEELIRILVMKWADLLLAPSKEAAANLKKMDVNGRTVRISGNTVLDAIRFASSPPPGHDREPQSYALATCHRLETITNRTRLAAVIALLNRISTSMPVIFVIHKSTRPWLERFRLDSQLSDQVTITESLDYPEFSYLMKNARCVIADGGSIQEECFYLGKPCLIIRRTTERQDGIGRNAMLWGFDDQRADGFLNTLDYLTQPPMDDACSPSAEAADYLLNVLPTYPAVDKLS